MNSNEENLIVILKNPELQSINVQRLFKALSEESKQSKNNFFHVSRKSLHNDYGVNQGSMTKSTEILEIHGFIQTRMNGLKKEYKILKEYVSVSDRKRKPTEIKTSEKLNVLESMFGEDVYSNLKPLELKIYLYLCYLSNNGLRIRVNTKEISEKVGFKKDAIINGLKSLELKSFIETLESNRTKGNLYLIKKKYINTASNQEPTQQENNDIGYLYVIGQVGNSDYVKIGVTTRDVEYRLKEIQTGNPFLLEIKGVIKDKKYFNLESHIHKILSSEKNDLVGEWFKYSDLTKTVLKNLGLDLKE
tara:strand:- start:9672 stop:10583 length:912 start_codon:yes stop_codon:yes gene_type:complete